MSLHRGREGEYEQRHNPIWRELEATLLRHGVRSYSIFLDPLGNDLFAYVDVESEEKWEEVAATDACRRWWASMKELMPTNPDDSPVTTSLREVFHLEAGAVRTARAAAPRAGRRSGRSGRRSRA